MDSLLEALLASDVLTEPMVDSARLHQSKYKLPIDSALLDLDLIDEDDLLSGLESCYKMTAARPHDLQRIDPEVAKTLQAGFSQSFRLCPLRLKAHELIALVEAPLSEESLEDLRNLFGLEPRQLLAPAHYLALARSRVYGTPLDQRTRDLEQRLSRRRSAGDVQQVLAKVERAASLNSAIADVLDFAAGLVEFSCFIVNRNDELKIAALRGGRASTEPIPLPEADCSLAAAIRYGGYFAGPMRGTQADQRFCQSLGRLLPRWALVAPVPTGGDTRVFLFADNGQRGIASRWAAELTLLTSRLGQLGRERREPVEEAFLLQIDQLATDPHLDEFTSSDAALAVDPMDALLKDLTAGNVLDEAMVAWAREHHSQHEVELDTALLELDLLDEEGLVSGLESCFGMTAARPYDLMQADPQVADLLPEAFRQACRLCPLRLNGNELVALVGRPLPEEALERLRSRHGLKPRQLIAISHYLALAEAKVFETPLDQRTRELEARLSRRRGIPDMQSVLTGVLQASTFPAAVAEVLDFAEGFLEYAGFMVCAKDLMRVAAVRGGQPPAEPLALPGPDCSLGAAFRQGGYFVGPLSGSGADHSFYRSLERKLPRWAFIAPVLESKDTKVFFYADNGPRGIATRWVAELSLLASRLGQRAAEKAAEQAESAEGGEIQLQFDQQVAARISPPRDSAPAELGRLECAEPPAVQPVVQDSQTAGPTAKELEVLERLKLAAAEAGQELTEFVDRLLARPRVQQSPESTSALVGEVRELFEKLATDIPAQLARGMETAFKAMVPRLAGQAAPAASFPTGVTPASEPRATGGIVLKESTGPREVPSYREKRRKTKRVKL